MDNDKEPTRIANWLTVTHRAIMYNIHYSDTTNKPRLVYCDSRGTYDSLYIVTVPDDVTVLGIIYIWNQ